ncbi:unnamed protein product [Brassica rapa subsp. narinosa]
MLCLHYSAVSFIYHSRVSAIPQTYPKIRKCLDNSALSKEETSKKKRRLSAKKRKCRRRLVFAIITDIELVAIYTCRRRPCFSFSDPFLPVSIFTVVATTTACHHTGHLSLSISLALSLCFEFVLVTRRWIRQRSLMVEEITKPLCGLKTLELSW